MTSDPPSRELVRTPNSLPSHRAVSRAAIPQIVAVHGEAAKFAWEEFFSAHLRNAHTRKAYLHAVNQFLQWLKPRTVPLDRVTPGVVGAYFDDHPGSIPTRKLHLAALRAFFDVLVTRHVLVLNPAASVRGERYQVVEGKTPEITTDQARKLLASIDTSTEMSLRDRAIIGVLIYTAARVGAVTKLRLKDFEHDGSQWTLRFAEKGGKSREIPVRHDLELFLLSYRDAAHLQGDGGNQPFFRSAPGNTGLLTDRPLSGIDICRMVKRRLKDAGLPTRLSPHSCRVATVTDLLSQGVPLEDVQFLAGHADPRTTRLYDRRQKKVTRNIVERISI
ncbi:MAG: site-specific integrase [Planctomycetes bacterium]|nr:site-specific integrase [Planctomycetota bacterium]